MSECDSECYIFYLCILLSIFGSAIMITHLNFFDIVQEFSQRLVLCLSASDFLYAIALLLYVNPPENGFQSSRCIIQGAITQFSAISAFIWSCSISYFSYVSITQGRNKIKQFEKYQVPIFVVGFLIPLGLSLVPLIFDSYSPTPKKEPTTCSIRSDSPDKTQNDNVTISLYLNMAVFYLPLMILVFISVIFVTKAIIKTRQVKSQNQLISKQLDIQSTFALNLTFYPLSLLICWLPSLCVFFFSINKFELITVSETIKILQYGMSFLQGFCNSLVYWWNTSQIKSKISALEQQDGIVKAQSGTLFSNNHSGSLLSDSNVANSLENLQDI